MAIFGGFSEKWVFFWPSFFSNFASGGQATADMDLKHKFELLECSESNMGPIGSIL